MGNKLLIVDDASSIRALTRTMHDKNIQIY